MWERNDGNPSYLRHISDLLTLKLKLSITRRKKSSQNREQVFMKFGTTKKTIQRLYLILGTNFSPFNFRHDKNLS